MHVVHVREKLCTHYIGRGAAPSGKHAQLGNPFVLRIESARTKVIEEYEEWVRRQPEVMKRIAELPEDAVLGCWCKPRACHGDVIIKIWKELQHSTAPDDPIDWSPL
jgi:hypothetical protein